MTMYPCNECAKLIIQSGIVEVIYYEVCLSLSPTQSLAKRKKASVRD